MSDELLRLVEEAESPDITQERLIEIVEVDFPSNIQSYVEKKKKFSYATPYGSLYCDLYSCVEPENIILTNRLIKSFLKNPLVPEKVFMKIDMVKKFWKELSVNPMLIIWIESQQSDVLTGINYYFCNVEHGISNYRNSHNTFLSILLKDVDKYDDKILSLLEEGANKIGGYDDPSFDDQGQKGPLCLPRVKPSMSEEDKIKVWMKFSKRNSVGIPRFLFQIMTGKYDALGGDANPSCYTNFCVTMLRRKRIPNEQSIPHLVDYLRWLNKVAKAVGKPMPRHILSSVFPNRSFRTT